MENMKRSYQRPALSIVGLCKENILEASRLGIDLDREDRIDAGEIGVKQNTFEENPFIYDEPEQD